MDSNPLSQNGIVGRSEGADKSLRGRIAIATIRHPKTHEHQQHNSAMDLRENGFRFLQDRFAPIKTRALFGPQQQGAMAVKNPSIYLKMKVLGAIDIAPGKTRDQRVRSVAEMTFLDEEGNQYRFTWRTIQTWYYRYKNYGITGMDASPRADKGKPRKTTPEEVLEAINQALPHFRQKESDKSRKHTWPPNKTAIYRFCIEKGLLQANQIARNTFSRMVEKYELLKTDPSESNKQRLAFSMQYANQLWQADTMFGPHIGGKQTKLIAFIDDASRVLCHGEFFLEENTDTMIRALRSALYKRGLPEQLLVDNGSIYCSQEITLICARVGCILRHTAVRDASAKGKIKRFFRRVRDQFLIRNLDLSSLQSLNRQFTDWVEQDYNATIHSTLGMKPIDRFGVDLSRIRFLSPSQDTDELFYAEDTRTVKKDNTFSFQGDRYESPIDMRGREIVVRYERHRKGLPIVYDNGRRLGQARLSVSLSRIADIAVHDGDLDLAAKLYDQDLAITIELYLSRPDNLTAKRDFCISLDRIGNMSAQRGLLEKAMDSYLESRRLREEMHAAEPTNRKAGQDLFVSYMKGGDTRMLMKEIPNAQSDYQKALSLADELARIDPQNANARRFQSMSAEVLADVAIAQMQLDDALQYAQKSLAISKELLLKDPSDGQMQRDLYICYLKVAKVYLARKDFNECYTQLDLALELAKSRYEQMPDSLQSHSDYSFVLLKRAEAYLEAGDAPSASRELEIVIPLLESVPEVNRQDVKSRRRIANAYTLLGQSLILQNQNIKAREVLDRARQLTVAMIDEGMRVDQMQTDLAEIDRLITTLSDAK